jgi:hypothetical protein
MTTLYILLYWYVAIAVLVGLCVYARNKNPDNLSKMNLRLIDLRGIAIVDGITWPFLLVHTLFEVCYRKPTNN